MERHVGILAILCTLWGALAMLVGTSLLLLSGGALAIDDIDEGLRKELLLTLGAR